jgi:hypothetical protein
LNIILVLVHLLLKVFLVLFTFITVIISLKTVVARRVEGASLLAVLMLRIACWLEMYWFLSCCGFFTTDDGQFVGRNEFGL